MYNDPIVKVTISEYKSFLLGLDQYPLEFMENYSVIKLKEDDDTIHAGLCDPRDYTLIENLQNFHQKQVVFYEIEKTDLAAFLGNMLSQETQVKDKGAARHDEKILLDKLANDAPIVNLVNSILIEAIRKEASDI